jgi:hypothetical protein
MYPMNQISEVVATLIHYKVVVRDTLEYTLKKDSYDSNLFKEKKRSILIEVDQPTPLKSIIDHSGDNGAKLEKLIREFYDSVYGDSSTILKLADDGLRVDHAQHIQIFNQVIPIHENIEAMIQGVVADGRKNGLDVADVARVDLAEERFYRGVAFMTLVAELAKLFGDYNEARREAKGEETPSSRFIGNDISAVVNDLSAVRNANHFTDLAYKNMEDKTFALVEMMTGRRDLPSGKAFPEIIKEAQDTIAEFVKVNEPVFRDAYVPLINALIAQAKVEGNKITPEAASAAKGSAKSEPREVEGEVEEIDPKTGLPKA